MMPLKRSDCTSDMRTTAFLAPTAMVPSALGSRARFLVPAIPRVCFGGSNCGQIARGSGTRTNTPILAPALMQG